MVFLSNPNNPTGRVMDADELAAVVEIARRADAWLIVDEVSQVSVHLWGELALFRESGVRFVMLGDFQGQLLPIGDSWLRPDSDVEHHALMRDMFNGLHARGCL